MIGIREKIETKARIAGTIIHPYDDKSVLALELRENIIKLLFTYFHVVGDFSDLRRR